MSLCFLMYGINSFLDVAMADPQPSLDLEDNYGEAVVPQPVSHCVSEIYP